MFPFLLTSIVSFLLSGVGTLLVQAFLRERVSLVGSLVGFESSQNSGIAFGVHLGVLQPVLTAIALCIVLILAWKGRASRWQQIGYGLVTGGALENILDRLRDGLVTDFIQVGSFPVFNIADSCITVGVVLLLAESVWKRR